MFDYEIHKNALLESCNHAINQLEEWRDHIAPLLAHFEGVIADGIVPPEDLEEIVYHLADYMRGSETIVYSIRDYVGCLKTNGNDYQTWDDTISRGRDLLSTLEGRVLFAGNVREYECIEDVIRDGFYKTSYWLRQRFLMSTSERDYSGLPFQNIYENVCISCHELIYELERFIYELERLKRMVADGMSPVVE